MYAERYYWRCATASSSVSWKGQAAVKWNGAMSLVIRMGLVLALFLGGGPSSLFYFGCCVNHSWRRRMEKNTHFILTQDASQGGHFFLLNCGDSFSPPRTLQCTQLVRILIIPPSHYPIAETFLFLFFFFFFSVHPFRAVDTDSWQMSEIIIVVIFFFSGYLSFAWQNVKSTEFQFCIVLQWG